MADNRNTLTDEILVLAETLGDIKARFERVESEFAVQSRPLEAALAALSAAMTGIKTLQHHVLDNSLSALSLKVEEQRKAIDDQINVIVSELKGADAQNDEKIALQTAELKQQFAEICANVQQLSSQFDAQIKRVELEAKEQITKFAAVTGPQGPAGASFNPKGNWQEGVFYQRLDVVSLLGTSYVSNVDNNASKPTKNSDKWTVLAARAGNVGGGGAGNFASLAGIAEVSQGGTGITQYAIGDILYANDTGSLARLPAGVNGQFLKTTGAGGAPEWETPTGGGDVVGPASATDNALVRFDGTSGTAIQNSNATLTDAGALTLASNLTVSGTGNNQIGGSGSKIGLGTAPNASAGTYIKNSSGYTLLVDTGRTDAGTTGIFLRDNAGSVRGWVGFDPTGTTLQISGNGGGTAIGDNLTVSGGTITSGSGTLTLNSSANTVVLQSAGTTALTLDSSQNATFAGSSVTLGSYGGSVDRVLAVLGRSTATGQTLRLADFSTAYGFDIVNDGTNAKLSIVRHDNSVSGVEALGIDRATGNATFAGKTYTAAGTAAAPAISFSGDTDTGFYNAGGNQMALACGGGQIWNTTVNGLSIASGKDIYLGNAYQAGAPTATGYLTIKDSAGNTYKVLVGT